MKITRLKPKIDGISRVKWIVRRQVGGQPSTMEREKVSGGTEDVGGAQGCWCSLGTRGKQRQLRGKRRSAFGSRALVRPRKRRLHKSRRAEEALFSCPLAPFELPRPPSNRGLLPPSPPLAWDLHVDMKLFSSRTDSRRAGGVHLLYTCWPLRASPNVVAHRLYTLCNPIVCVRFFFLPRWCVKTHHLRTPFVRVGNDFFYYYYFFFFEKERLLAAGVRALGNRLGPLLAALLLLIPLALPPGLDRRRNDERIKK